MKKLNLHCPINTTSYGYVSSHFLKNIYGHYDLRHIPISENQPDDDLKDYLSKPLNSGFLHKDATTLKIWHQHDLYTYTRPNIGFPIFELDRFNDRERHSLSYPDFLFVCSEWAKDVVSSFVDKEICVVPLGYDENIFKPDEFDNKNVTIFANFGKFEVRKGHDVLLKAFNLAFEKDDNVALVMMPTNYFLTGERHEQWISSYKHSKLGDKIEFVPRLKTQSMVYNIMKQVHCGVFPARAEGWNLEALEMLACGKHLIISNCTGHTEFVNAENSMLIDMDKKEPAHDPPFFFGQGDWYSFEQTQVDQLVEHLRSFHKKNMFGEISINSKGIKDSSNFTWSKSSRKLIDTIDKVVS